MLREELAQDNRWILIKQVILDSLVEQLPQWGKDIFQRAQFQTLLGLIAQEFL